MGRGGGGNGKGEVGGRGRGRGSGKGGGMERGVLQHTVAVKPDTYLWLMSLLSIWSPCYGLM